METKKKIITKEADLDEGFLNRSLDERQKPTDAEFALEVAIFWGTECIDVSQVRGAGSSVRAMPRIHESIWSKDTTKATMYIDADLPASPYLIAENFGRNARIWIPAEAPVGVRSSEGKIDRKPNLKPNDAPYTARTFDLSMGDRIAFKVGTLTFVVQYVRGNAALAPGGAMDWYFPRVLTISAMLHIFFVVAAFLTPDANAVLSDDLFRNENRFAQMILKAQEEQKRPKLDLSGMKEGARAKDEEGKFGKKDKPKEDKAASKQGAPKVDPNKREKDRKIALNAGLLGMLKGAEGGAVSNIFGPGGIGTGINNAMGGLQGAGMGDAGGAGGLGARGTGAGGGGSALGIGGLGTHGSGRGKGGYGNIDLGGRGKGQTRIIPGRTIIQGGLSKEEIGRVIMRNLARFKYCYEKELNRNPNLSGKVGVYFTIAPTGSVAEASVRETSVNDTNVEECVVRVMRSLKFPNPKGGGIVVVTYPFVFEAT